MTRLQLLSNAIVVATAFVAGDYSWHLWHHAKWHPIIAPTAVSVVAILTIFLWGYAV